jgi:RNA polymerase sigma factor (sigma-70 family)
VNDKLLGEFNIEYSFQDQLINMEISEEKRVRLQQAIITLSPGQKEIIYLKFEQELEYPEIAHLMNITIESARKQLYRVLLSLRHILDNEVFLTLFSYFRKKV